MLSLSCHYYIERRHYYAVSRTAEVGTTSAVLVLPLLYRETAGGDALLSCPCLGVVRRASGRALSPTTSTSPSSTRCHTHTHTHTHTHEHTHARAREAPKSVVVEVSPFSHTRTRPPAGDSLGHARTHAPLAEGGDHTHTHTHTHTHAHAHWGGGKHRSPKEGITATMRLPLSSGRLPILHTHTHTESLPW